MNSHLESKEGIT